MATVRVVNLSSQASATSAEHIATSIARGLTGALNRGG